MADLSQTAMNSLLLNVQRQNASAESLSQAICASQTQSQMSHGGRLQQSQLLNSQLAFMRQQEEGASDEEMEESKVETGQRQDVQAGPSQFETPSQFIRSYQGLNFATQVASMQEDQEQMSMKFFERQENALDNDIARHGHKFVDPALFVDFTHFPLEFNTIEDCLQTYNKLGLCLKIQFKKYNIRRNDNGFAVQFSMCCASRIASSNKINQGVQLKERQKFDCPVIVKFKWNNDRMTYYRSRALNMQHNHELVVKDRCTILSNPAMLKDLQHWVRCKVSVPNIVKLLNRKYQAEGALARYQDVYGLVKQITQTQQPSPSASSHAQSSDTDPTSSTTAKPHLKEQLSEFEILMECLQKARQKHHQMYFAYQLKGSDKERNSDERENAYLHFARGHRQHVDLADVTGLFFVLPAMHSNYKRFPELLFIDCSIRQKNKATEQGETHYFQNFVFMQDFKAPGEESEHLHLIILSGVNNEGQNVVFAVAIVQQICYETFCWLLFHFRQANMTYELTIDSMASDNRGTLGEDKNSFAEPETIISTFQQGIAQAIALVFSHRVTHLYCQNSVKQFMRAQLAHLVDAKAEPIQTTMSEDMTKQWKTRHENRAAQLQQSLVNKGSDFTESKESIAAGKQFLASVLELVEETESERFLQMQESIFQAAPDLLEQDKVTLLRLLLTQKEKWSSAFTPATFTCGTRTMNRALKIAKMINSKLYGRCNVLELYKLFEDFEANSSELKGQATMKQADSQLVLHHPLLRELRLHCTTFAFQHMFYQSMHSHCIEVHFLTPTQEKPQEEGQTLATRSDTYPIKVIDLRTREVTVVMATGQLSSSTQTGANSSLTSLECPCEFRKAFGLICCHVFAILNVCQVKRVVRSSHQGLSQSLIRRRWLRRMNLNPSEDSSFLQKMGINASGITVDEADADFVDSQSPNMIPHRGRDNPYQIFLTTEMRESGADRLLGIDMPLDGQLLLK